MKRFIEGSYAVAEIIKLCRPGVIAAYPITPQTHIVEELALMVANGELKAEFINVESEHSAASVVLGASATGVRAFSATSSQGLLLMLEVLFNIAGMRLPLVITCANRSVSAPLNIWNDHQDSVTIRDSGFIQFYAETNQEACDLHIQAYRLSEDPDILLPVMVCMDGYLLTHAAEVVDIPEEEAVTRFLPPYKPVLKLDPDEPITMGILAGPEHYMETRFAIHETLTKDVLRLIPNVVDEFEKVFGRRSGGLVEGYRIEDAKEVIVAKGSVVGTIKEVVDEMRGEGKKVGVLKIITYRPFPCETVYNLLKGIEGIGVLEKSISLGAGGPLYIDLKSVFHGRNSSSKISGFIAGLGGRDITKESIREVFVRLSGEQVDSQFIDLKV